MLLTLVVIGGGTVAGLWAAGLVDLPFLRHEVSHEGMVAVPMSGQLIPAYTKVTRDHLADPATHGLKLMWISKESVSPEMITELGRIIGRVMDHDKPAGYVFTEKDFLPAGTRAGMVAGIPPGKRSLTLDASKLSGVFNLKAGDHIDLLATVPVDASKTGGSRYGSAALAAQMQIASAQKRAAVRPLAQDAVIVEPVTTRQKPITSNSLTQGSTTRTIPVQEIVIAVAPSEVAPLTEAMATQVEVMCVARSGLPSDPGSASKTPGSDPMSGVNVIDVIAGKKRDAVAVTANGLPQYLGQSGELSSGSQTNSNVEQPATK